MMGRLLVILAIGTSLYGCAETGYGKSDESWNTWIGTTKDDRVKDQGIPTRCHTFKSGGEACEWPVTWAPNSVGTITMTFDPKGIACQWSYKDVYIEKRSAQKCQ